MDSSSQSHTYSRGSSKNSKRLIKATERNDRPRSKKNAASAKTSPVRRVPRRVKSDDGDSSSPKKQERGRSHSPATLRFPSFGRSKSRSKSSSSRRPKRSVSFDKVQIREFQQVLGEHPCSDDGPSLALGWEYNEKKQINLDRYEAKRNGTGLHFQINRSSSSASNPESMFMTPRARKEIALDWGYTPQQIAENQKQSRRIKKKREKTVNEVLDLLD